MSRRQVEELARRLRKMPKYKTKLYLEKKARIQEALKAYHNLSETEITSFPIIAGIFNVSYTTLYRREQGAKPLSENEGYNTCLNKAQEMSLIWYMDIAIKRGFLLRYNMVTRAATQILEAIGLINRDNNYLGNNWALY
jgi:hypothetical protein